MTWTILFTEQYNKKAARFIQKYPDAISQYGKALKLLESNPYHPSLRLHPLKGRLEGLFSISINLQYRITLEFMIADKEIIPINVGDHDQVYK